jgi:predicted RNA-binding protein YlqC (UPF0109 family)
VAKDIEGENAMKELIEHIAQALVDHPKQVEVFELGGQQTRVLELKVAKEDIGKVIGRGGQTVAAMRTILNASSRKGNKRFILEIFE